MLGVGVMGNEVRFFFFLAAAVAFVLDAVDLAPERIRLVSVGLALFVIPFAWDTFALGFD